MRRRAILAGLGGAVLAIPAIVRAQPRADLPKVGLLFAAAPPIVAARVDAFRESLAGLGFGEGKQVALELAYADGNLARLPSLADRLVRMPVNVIVTGGSSATGPAVAATSAIPIVMAQDNDPVGAGFVKSLSRPGGNVTGLTTLIPELSAKQLALLKEIVPGIARVALFGDSGEPSNDQSVHEAERAAVRLGIELRYLDTRKVGDPAQLVAAATRDRCGGVLVLGSAALFVRQDEIIARMARAKLPAVYANSEFVQRGGLATYGVNVMALFGQAAAYVVKILNGAKPSDLPIQQPTRFAFVINLKAARAIGLVIPQPVLLRADEVIQ